MATRRLVFSDPTDGIMSEVTPATDEFLIAKITLSGLTGIGIDGGAVRAANFADPTAAQDLATKSYVDAVATGLDIKASVRVATAAALAAVTAAGSGVGKTLTANANGALTVDGVAVSSANRVLVKDQVAGANNGIYVVTAAGSGGSPFVLTRATDFDANAEVTAGAFTFVEEGTTNGDTGWVLVTDNPITVDTTALVFSQFSTTASLTYDAGLLKTGTSISVEVDTGANAQGAGSDGGSSGLEFDTTGGAGKLRAAVNATAGLQRTASGLGVKLNGSTLASAAGGLSVSNAPTLKATLVANAAIAVGDPVRYNINDKVIKALATSAAAARVIAVASSAATVDGDPVDVIYRGILTGVLVAATVNTPYFLAAGGGITITRPTGGNEIVRVGYAINATDLMVDIQVIGRSAA